MVTWNSTRVFNETQGERRGEVNERRGERKEGTDAGESKDKRQS